MWCCVTHIREHRDGHQISVITVEVLTLADTLVDVRVLTLVDALVDVLLLMSTLL